MAGHYSPISDMDVLITSTDGVGVQTAVNVVGSGPITNEAPIRRVQCSVSLGDSISLGLQLGSTLILNVCPTLGSSSAPR